jgi:hypothetical protein
MTASVRVRDLRKPRDGSLVMPWRIRDPSPVEFSDDIQGHQFFDLRLLFFLLPFTLTVGHIPGPFFTVKKSPDGIAMSHFFTLSSVPFFYPFSDKAHARRGIQESLLIARLAGIASSQDRLAPVFNGGPTWSIYRNKTLFSQNSGLKASFWRSSYSRSSGRSRSRLMKTTTSF